MPAGRPAVALASPEPSDADDAELLRLARGNAPEDRPYAIAHRVRLESAGLIRRRTRMAWDGEEVPAGWTLTTAGWARVREIAGGAWRGPAEVVREGVCIAQPAPDHNHE